MELALVNRESNQSWLQEFLTQITSYLKELGLQDFEFQSVFKSLVKTKELILKIHSAASEDTLLEDITIIREKISKIIVKAIITDYIELLKKNSLTNANLRLAFDFYGSGLSIWVETDGEDRNVQEILEDIELRINRKYSAQKIEVQTIVFDKSYDFCFPPQYVTSNS